jgi:hypothetical protein
MTLGDNLGPISSRGIAWNAHNLDAAVLRKRTSPYVAMLGLHREKEVQ